MFSERYAHLRLLRAPMLRERDEDVPEHVVQCVWYDQLFDGTALTTQDGRRVRVVSPGWWNRSEGPDFKGAQLEFNGRLRTGDVEIHLRHGDWRNHGHHFDTRYDEVLLNVVLQSEPPDTPIETASGRAVAVLSLAPYLGEDIRAIADRLAVEDFPYRVEGTLGHCAALVEAYGSDNMMRLLELAGEWRVLFKARALRERMDRVSADQAIYEEVLAACGFSHFKYHFHAVARQLPYERARQLALEDALLLEAAFLQLAGLLPNELPEVTSAAPHFARLRALRRDKLSGLRPMPLEWKRVGVRPTNNPERRFAGAARFLARTAKRGLAESLHDVWQTAETTLARRQAFEKLFSAPGGFWATQCTWTGKQLQRPVAMIGGGRVRSIIGNVFIPAALAIARQKRDRLFEERVFDFYAKLPSEPDNHILNIMAPRLFGLEAKPKLTFRTQQGLLQMHRDWCEPNPSCRNCRVIQMLDAKGVQVGEMPLPSGAP